MPALTAQSLRRNMGLFKLPDGVGMHMARGIAPGAIGREVPVPLVIQYGFGDDRSRRITRTQK